MIYMYMLSSFQSHLTLSLNLCIKKFTLMHCKQWIEVGKDVTEVRQLSWSSLQKKIFKKNDKA